MALTGAQAADLPVKAKPVQYVKICSMYGVGFYYIPGTDMCIKVGGYVRFQTEWGSSNGLPYGSSYNGIYGPAGAGIANALFSRQTDNLNFTARGVISVDARNQTEFGTVRGYIRLGMQSLTSGTTAATFMFERAFIQWAGFTAGRTQSFFDIFTNTERFTYTDAKTSGDTYNYGVDLVGYTVMLGNGFSASISAESPHYPAGVGDGTSAVFGAGTTTLDTSGLRMPDIVGNLRLDQNWGYVGVSGAIHQVSGRYYNVGNGVPPFTTHPADKYGWAAQVGGLVNLPWLGSRDSMGASFVYSKGAIGYATKGGSWQIFDGNSAGVGWVVDGLFDTNAFAGGNGNTPIHLTNAWSVNAGYEHFWNPQWRTSLYGGYTRVWYDAQIKNLINTHLPGAAASIQCGVPVAGAVWPNVNVSGSGGGVGNSCSPNFSFYQVGSRTQWNINKDFYMGVDVTYTHLNSAYEGVALPGYNGSGRTAQFVDNQNVWSGIFRVQRDFTADNEGPSIVFGR